MKEQLLQKLLELINKGQNFLEGQLPDIANQLLKYYMIQSVIDSLASGCILGFAWYIAYRAFKENEFEVCTFFFFFFFIGFIAFCAFIYNVIDIAQIHWAPKAYLLKSLIGGKCG